MVDQVKAEDGGALQVYNGDNASAYAVRRAVRRGQRQWKYNREPSSSSR